MIDVLSDQEKFPLLDEAGRRLLQAMREHPSAPPFNHRCGDRLTAEGLAEVQSFERGAQQTPKTKAQPEWLDAFVRRCLDDVPFYMKRKHVGGFADQPTCSRADLAREPWSFVPYSQPLDNLVVYDTNGTTGHYIQVLSHPDSNSKYLALIRLALARLGTSLDGGAGRVSVAVVCAQQHTFTFASLSYYLGGAGAMKLNLLPWAWRRPEDRALYLQAWNPEVISGDPISLQTLLTVGANVKPKAIVSTAMALLPGLRKQLQDGFGCPVLDLYSMNECRFIAADFGNGFEVTAPDVHVEILDANGMPCAPGVRGEVVVSGGRNPFLPLLRYRTGDFATLDVSGAVPQLRQLETRQPVVFESARGEILNNIDVSYAIREFAFSQFTLRQRPDRSLIFKAPSATTMESTIRSSLADLFGEGMRLDIGELREEDSVNGKVIAYGRIDA